ncbi:hypothetical protein H6P81_012704 [Aristolochia fimbriata]|uniref:CCHC-type domain-containing protein n=1 Tax=Aristolochia fimbriata TaxID=158543 RepID=A0AAV7EFG3_ARIFI|nr:hypothetical protein H6P81_012704 [Aristolochia fimbriata]
MDIVVALQRIHRSYRIMNSEVNILLLPKGMITIHLPYLSLVKELLDLSPHIKNRQGGKAIALVKVEIDLHVESIALETKEKILVFKFKIENKPKVCFKCERWGHSTPKCRAYPPSPILANRNYTYTKGHDLWPLPTVDPHSNEVPHMPTKRDTCVDANQIFVDLVLGRGKLKHTRVILDICQNHQDDTPDQTPIFKILQNKFPNSAEGLNGGLWLLR